MMKKLGRLLPSFSCCGTIIVGGDKGAEIMEKVKKKQTIVFVIILVLFILSLTIGFGIYSNNVNNQINIQENYFMNEIGISQQIILNEELEKELSNIESIARTLVVLGHDEERMVEYISVLEELNAFKGITIVDREGNGIDSSNTKISIYTEKFFQEALLGETTISDRRTSLFSDQEVIVVAAPIYESGEIAGVVSLEYPITYFTNLLFNLYEGDGQSYIYHENGHVVVGQTEHGWVDQIYDEVDSYAKTLSLPLHYNDWHILLVVPNETLGESSKQITEGTENFIIFMGVIAVALIVGIWYMRTQSIREIEKVAYTDALTGLPNLHKFKQEIAKVLRSHPKDRYAIVKMDIANFKMINELFDFETGNKVLKGIAEVGRDVTAKDFMKSRVGTDEFLMFADADFFADLEKHRVHYEGLLMQKVPFISKHSIRFRYGRYTIESNEEDVNGIIDKVTLAHGYAKMQKGYLICDYDGAFKERMVKATHISDRMEAALEQGEFQVYLQPKMDMEQEKIVGAEALVRWYEGDGKLLYPGEFIPVFESNGFIEKLDLYIFEHVCQMLEKWKWQGKELIPISVNFSRNHLKNETFVDDLCHILKEYKVDAGLLEIELLESSILHHEAELRTCIEKLHIAGFTISMDDFGAGYSSLGLLKDFNLDKIKLDRSFLVHGEDSAKAEVIIQSIVEMARSIGVKSIAEGVESEEHIEFLKRIGCHVAQGYYYSKPIPVSKFEEKFMRD